MQNEFIKQFSEAGKTSYAALQELGTIQSKVLQKLTELQFNLATLTVETGVEQAKLFGSTANYKDLLATESDVTSKYSSKVLDITRLTADILSESQDEIIACFEKGIEAVSKPKKAAAKRITKKETAKETA
ncbi:MAG: TIGR01841 family phasin [Gammaproteobacteria bacterium]